jgi:hypothetical protein
MPPTTSCRRFYDRRGTTSPSSAAITSCSINVALTPIVEPPNGIAGIFWWHPNLRRHCPLMHRWAIGKEFTAMCDYSLHGVASRHAMVGDRLVTRRFWNTTTGGFSSIEEPALAVCLLPGTEVGFEKVVQRELTGFQLIWRGRKAAIPYKVARFRQVNMENPCTHHDALEFPDGEIVLLTHLCAGQRATVLQLPVQAQPLATAQGAPEKVNAASIRARSA